MQYITLEHQRDISQRDRIEKNGSQGWKRAAYEIRLQNASVTTDTVEEAKDKLELHDLYFPQTLMAMKNTAKPKSS